MPGTVCTYQGFPVRSMTFRRTRGWRADTTIALLFAADFPQGFEFVTPSPGGLSRPRTLARPDLSAIRPRGRRRQPRPPPRQRRLNFAGTLVMAEVDDGGREYVVKVNLFCTKLETIKRDAKGAVAIVRATLVDERFFYSQGFLRKWSFNRTGPKGEYRRDSVKKDGKPFTLGEIAKSVAGDLFDTPTLTKYPTAWDKETPETELRRFGSATIALVKLSQEHHTEELCLGYNGQVALWKPGDGKVGYAPDGKGVENTAAFPRGLQLYLQGTGQSKGIEATYPPDFLVVVGGLRVASVRLDNLDPVLVIDNEPIPLTEETTRKLTKNKYGLAWLKRFVLAPQAYQNDVALPPVLVQLLREQAWRLWRIPDVEKEKEPKPGKKKKKKKKAKKKKTKRTEKAPKKAERPRGRTDFERLVDLNRRITATQPTRVPGPNAHLLPLRDRAETVAGRRLPVRVDAYRFKSMHRAMAPSRHAQRTASSRKRLQQLKREIQAQARKRGKKDPFNSSEAFWLFQDKYVSPKVLYDIVGGLKSRSVSYEEFQTMINRARLLDRIGEVSGELASAYKQELTNLFGLQEEAGGLGKQVWELAQEVVAFEKEVAESRSPLETPDEEAKQRANQLRLKAQDNLRAIDKKRQQKRFRSRIRSRPTDRPQMAVFVKNLPRKPDPHARVYSQALGIIQTSELSGWVKEEGVPVAEATSFVPKSPLVTFGAVLRPRIDGGRTRPTTGVRRSKDESKVPSVLTDKETFYTAAFKRVARGRADQITVDKIPKGEGTPIERPDLVELVPLEGESNKRVLDDTAKTVARGIFQRREKIEAGKFSLARPWPVVCDGVVAGVEIAMRDNGRGFVTTVHVGSGAEPVEGLGKTRVRVRRGGPSDKAAREGLLP